MIHRNVTRTILNSAETTKETFSINSSTLLFELTTSDSFYVGYQGKFAARHFNFSTPSSVAGDITVQYWNGSAWAAVLDPVDQTYGFTQSGFISWENQNDWQVQKLTPIDDVDLYWIKITVGTDLAIGTLLQSVVNLFSDDEMLRIYYPELITDSRYLPASRTNFLEQHQAAKDKIVQVMKQRRLITGEDQVIDINTVAIAATHMTAYMIYLPIATSEQVRILRDDAYKAAFSEIDQLALSVDQNKDGTISDAERSDFGETLLRRR